MRHYIALVVAIVAARTAATAEPTEAITVTASATVYAKPDAARIHYVVRASDASVDAAKDTASKQLATLSESIKSLKLANLTITAGEITYNRSMPSRAARAGFPGGPGNPGPGLGPVSAQTRFTATIIDKDAEKLHAAVDAFIAKAAQGGAMIAGDGDPDSPFTSSRLQALNEAPRIDWYLTNDSAARSEAYRTAIRKAKEDAATLSKELGWDKFTIFSVADGPSTGFREPIELVTTPSRSPAGEVAVTVRVTLKCSR